MSNYNTDADKAEKQLKYISPSMCYAKWAQVSLHLTNGMNSSCYHPPLHAVSIDEINHDPSALHNTSEKKKERTMMLKGEKPSGCNYCWKIEEVGNRSDRIYRSGEPWAQNSRKEIISSLDTLNIIPKYVEVNFNQACNFKCMYCSPHLSTAWEEEIKQHGPYKVFNIDKSTTLHNDITYLAKQGLMPLKVKQDENPYLIAFWKWWPTLYKKLEVFRITGGEPLMDVNTFKVLDYIHDNPNSDLTFSITTNMCPPKQELMDKFIEKIKKLERIQIWNDPDKFNPGSGNNWYVNMALRHFSLFVSVDGVGKQAEYIRSGLDFDVLNKNVVAFLNNTDNTDVTFINTFNALSVPGIKKYLEYVLQLRSQFSKENQGTKNIPIHDPYTKHNDYVIHPRQRIWFDVPLLRSPQWQCIQVLPGSFDHYIEEAISFMEANMNTENFVGFYDFEVEKLKRNLKVLQENRFTDDIHRINFVKFFKQYDDRKGTNFLEVFPEFTDLMESTDD